MKKIPKSISIKISPVVLYIEDLEEIEEIYKDNFENYKIIAESKKLEDDFEFDSVQELTERLNRKNIVKLNNLSFTAYNSCMDIDFRDIEAKIYSSNNDVKSIGITNKLKNVADKRPMSHKYLSNYLPMFLLFNLFLFLSSSINILPEPVHKITNVLLILLFIIWSFWWYNLKTKNYSIIYLERKSLQKGFLERNKNVIGLIGTIIAIFGIIITFISLN